MTVAAPMLGPVIALVAWSLVMWIWMYVARLPAIRASGMKLDPEAPRGTQMATLPPRVRWKADNFNHLMEQPQVFYAIAIVLALLGVDSPVSLALAWAYVVLRVIHSLFQALVNTIPIRFVLFVASNVPLFALTAIAAMELLGGSGQ